MFHASSQLSTTQRIPGPMPSSRQSGKERWSEEQSRDRRSALPQQGQRFVPPNLVEPFPDRPELDVAPDQGDRPQQQPPATSARRREGGDKQQDAGDDPDSARVSSILSETSASAGPAARMTARTTEARPAIRFPVVSTEPPASPLRDAPVGSGVVRLRPGPSAGRAGRRSGAASSRREPPRLPRGRGQGPGRRSSGSSSQGRQRQPRTEV